MTDKELLEQLRTEVVAETPDCWSAILARVQAPAQQPEEEKIVPIGFRPPRNVAAMPLKPIAGTELAVHCHCS